jgi:hypothetical protein
MNQLSSTMAAPANASLSSEVVSNPSTSASLIITPPELERTLALLSSNRSVLGYLLLSRGQPVSIIKHSGVIFEGEQGKKYATATGKIVEGVQAALEEVSDEPNEAVCLSIRSSLPYNVNRVLGRHSFYANSDEAP